MNKIQIVWHYTLINKIYNNLHLLHRLISREPLMSTHADNIKLSIQRYFASGSRLKGIIRIHLMIYFLECKAKILMYFYVSWLILIVMTDIAVTDKKRSSLHFQFLWLFGRDSLLMSLGMFIDVFLSENRPSTQMAMISCHVYDVSMMQQLTGGGKPFQMTCAGISSAWLFYDNQNVHLFYF